MTLNPPTDIPSNYVTEAAIANGQPYIYLKSNGRPDGTTINLSSGETLGLVQRAEWNVTLTGLSRLTVETIASPAEFCALQQDTTILVRPAGHPLIWVYHYYANKLRRFFTH